MTDVPMFLPIPDTRMPAYVRTGEELVWRGRPTIALLVSQALGLIGSFVFFGIFLVGAFGQGERNVLFAVVPGLLVIVFILILILNSIRIRRTEYVLTRQSIYARTGIIGQTVIQTSFDKITDISLKQDVLGRLLGFASLHINTAGSGTPPVRMEGLRDALSVKSLVEEAREAFLKRGERRAPSAPSPPRAYPRFVPDRLVIRLTCPTTKQAFKRPASEVGRRAPCPHCGKTHLVQPAKEKPRGKPRTA